MNKKQFSKFLERDRACPHCGSSGPELIPQHRQNRGMGGSKLRDKPSNIMVLCSEANGLLESNATFANLGRAYGWKLTSGQIPSESPVLLSEGWYLIDDNFNKVRAKEPEQE